jgi:hypothetical protein
MFWDWIFLINVVCEILLLYIMKKKGESRSMYVYVEFRVIIICCFGKYKKKGLVDVCVKKTTEIFFNLIFKLRVYY